MPLWPLQPLNIKASSQLLPLSSQGFSHRSHLNFLLPTFQEEQEVVTHHSLLLASSLQKQLLLLRLQQFWSVNLTNLEKAGRHQFPGIRNDC